MDSREMINEAIDRLAMLEIPATPKNVDTMASVYNLLFRIRDAGGKAAEDREGEKEENG